MWVNHTLDEGIQSAHEIKGNIAYRITCLKEGTIYATQTTIKKIEKFFIDYSFAMALTGASLITIYCSPQLFMTGLALSVITRIEFKNWVNEYIKDHHNPYFLKSEFGPDYLNAIDVTLASVVALDALALKTLFFSPYAAVNLLPFVGGMVAGNCLAKIGMDLAG
jgi:hypothetical protein